MNSTFVYNDGEAINLSDELHLSFGLFFDGTLNNKENTRIREAVQGGIAKAWEKDAYKMYGGKPSSSSSYQNDYSNVARMQMTCVKSYAIYVEGIGTVDRLEDVSPGAGMGSGDTGIRGKVRKGCMQLIETIFERIGKGKKIKQLKSLRLDVFGFSRGAAAARNFVYEVNGSRRTEDDKVKTHRVRDGNEFYEIKRTPSYANDFQQVEYRPKYKTIYLDRDEKEVDPEFLEKGSLPRFGYFGYLLLKNEIVSKEELKSLRIDIRFIGLYDTVSSYEDVGDSTWKFLRKGFAHLFKNQFQDDVEQLQLNNLGSFHKAVHFTAMDEHRENFDLTRLIPMSCAVEKKFPGVHSDVGGSYMTGEEVVDEVENANYSLNWLSARRMKLIEEYWYKEDQLKITRRNLNKATRGLLYAKLTGKRFLHKEYSYIPLHLMMKMFTDLIGKDKKSIIAQQIEDKYPLKTKTFVKPAIENQQSQPINKERPSWKKDIPVYDGSGSFYALPKKIQPLLIAEMSDDEILIQAKKYLDNYVLGDGKVWTFMSDEEVQKRNERRALKELKAEVLKKQEEVFGEKADDKSDAILLDGVTVKAYDSQYLLRKLRNRYLHWSADRDWVGMSPRDDYKRVEH